MKAPVHRQDFLSENRKNPGLACGATKPISRPSETQNRLFPAFALGTPMLQSAIFADLQVNNFGIPTVRLSPALPIFSMTRHAVTQIGVWLRGPRDRVNTMTLSDHLRRDIGIED